MTQKKGITFYTILFTIGVVFAGLSPFSPFKSLAFSVGKKGLPIIRVGNKFPLTELVTPSEKVYRDYLGLPEKPIFYLNDVKAEVLIVEFLNKYCYHCQKQAYVMDRIYRTIKRDPSLNGRVKMIGIGVGNNKTELDHFRQEKRIPFPLIPDKDFVAFESIGWPDGTPFTLIAKKEKGVFVVEDTHLGMIENRQAYMDTLHQILNGNVTEGPRAVSQAATKPLSTKVTMKRIGSMIRKRLQETGVTTVGITPLNLKDVSQTFMIKLKKGGNLDVWFAVIGTGRKVCDICHNISFIYLFDRRGDIKDFIPIFVTKFGNKPFDKKDVEKIRGVLTGRNLTQPIQYNPDTDAVSSASMTSALIFRSIRKGRLIYDILKKEGYTE